MPTAYVSEDVWASLNPRDGLSPKDRRRWLASTFGLGLLSILVACLYWSGLPVARLSSRPSSSSANTRTRTFSYLVPLHNDGWVAVHVRGVGRDGPGLRLVSVGASQNQPVDALIGPGDEIELELKYQVTDCEAVPSERWPIPVQVQRPWGGTQTVHVQQPLLTGPNAPKGLRAYSGEDPYGQSWQKMLADLACHPSSG